MSLFDKLFNNIGTKKQVLGQGNENIPLGLDSEKVTGSTDEGTDGMALLKQLKEGSIGMELFIYMFGKATVFYSTPFGDHKDGGSRLFLLPARDKTAYLPVFSSRERAVEFYEKAGRKGYLIIEGSFASCLETTKKINQGKTPIKMGAVIDPGYHGITIDAPILDKVLDIIK